MTALDATSVHVGAGSARGAWTAIARFDRLTPDRGVAALVDGVQVAVVRLSTGALHAVDNVDPCSGAAVLSRGIVGDADGVPTLASPLYKQRFDLRTGRCLDADVEPLRVHDVAVHDGVVVVRRRTRA
jgi:nitrite reductase (NADH) small subunit